MPSPFPGMDPFLEAHWGDVHTALSTYIRNDIQSQLPNDLLARIEESGILEVFDDDNPGSKYSRKYPDVGVFETSVPNGTSPVGAGNIAVAEPLMTISRFAKRTQRSVHIYDPRRKMKLVTAIEVISPGNKIGAKNRDTYRERSEQILDSGASLVEIDLIRQGRHVLYAPALEERGHYAICVIRGWKPDRAEVYPVRFDVALPTIRIPLRRGDTDAILELQKLLDRAYADGRYHSLDYSRPLTPPFTAAENRWLKAQLKKRA